MNLVGKTFVVTGSSSGMGAEVARLARFHGAKVVGVDRNDPMTTVDAFVKTDLSQPDQSTMPSSRFPENLTH